MENKRIHFIGIGGYGMGPLAKIMLDMGYCISGSDMKVSERTERMARLGAKVTIGHSADNIDPDTSQIVISAAVPLDNVELVRAREMNIPVVTHAQMVGQLLSTRTGIGVTGAHGKTTTTSMVATVLSRGGLSPTVLVGGEVDEFAGGGKLGDSELFVVEADEAYGRFLEMHPRIAAVTNIDDDHLDFYQTFDNVLGAFERFISELPPQGIAILNMDDVHVRKLVGAVASGCKTVTYGLANPAELMAKDIQVSESGSAFTVMQEGQPLGRVRLRVPGMHNVSNSLVAVAVGLEMGLAFEDISSALGEFGGVHRRFEVYGTPGDVMIVDDYAHHPTEIRAVLRAARAGWDRRLVAIFQPQRFTRTQSLMSEFAKAFDEADIVILSDIYYVGTGEQPIPGVTSERVLELLNDHWKVTGKDGTAIHIGDINEITKYVTSICRSGDLVITMGAGNISQVAESLTKEIETSVRMGHTS